MLINTKQKFEIKIELIIIQKSKIKSYINITEET